MLVVLSASVSLFISGFVLCTYFIVFIFISTLSRYKVKKEALVTVCRCNVNIAFVLQMWRAESLKAGAGSRSKAAKPRPPPSSVCYHAVSAW